jgi:Tfp pilus assembly protein PilE
MTESIIVAIITGVLTLAGVLISNSRSDAVQNERIEQLRAEVKKHNNLIERVFHLESRADRHDDEFKRVNARLTDLEKEERE